ncbi:MAG: SIMPL domain-containing protein [bacterium]
MPKLEKENLQTLVEQPRGNKTVTVLLSVLIAIVTISGAVLTFLQWQNNQPKSTLSVSGVSQKDVDQDTATIYFYLTFKGDDINLLNKKADESSNKVLNFLLDSGIKNKEIENNRNSYDDYSIYPVMMSSSSSSEGIVNRPKVVELSFKVNFTNFGDNPQKPNDILGKLGQFGVERYSSFQYSLTESKKQEVCDGLQSEAIKKAVENSQKQLEAIGGGTIIKKDVKNVTSCPDLFYPYPMYATKDAMVGSTMDSVSASSLSQYQTNSTPPILAGKANLKATAEIVVEYRGK